MPITSRFAAAAARAYGMFRVMTAQAVDPFFNYVTALLHGDGTNGAQNNTFLDSSTNNFTITRNGNTTQGTFSPFSQTGWSNYFNGSSKLSITSNAAFGFGTGDFTIELWVYCAFNGAIQEFIDARSSDTALPWVLGINGTGLARTYDGTTLRTGGQLTSNSWNHVAWVRATNVNTVYVNGVAGHTWTASQNFGSSNPIVIGDNVGPTSEPLTGYISNLRIVKGTAVYTAAFIPPTTPLTAISGTSLLTCQSNRFIDNSTNAFAITVTGSPSVQAFSPFNPTSAWSASSNGGSGYFDGSGDYLTAANNAAFALPGDFTVEAWVYFSSNTTAVFCGNILNTGTGDWAFFYNNSFGIRWITDNGATVLTGTYTMPLNAWTHVAITRSGTSVRIFANGVLLNTVINSSSNSFAGTMYIGSSNNGSLQFPGYMTDLRIVKGTAVYTAAFTPPTAPLTAITNTSLLLNYTNGGIYDNAAVGDYETVGNAQVSTSVVKYGTGSMAFDGTGDWLVAPANQLFAFGTGAFTVEFWLYINSLPAGVAGIVDTGTSVNANRFSLVLYSSGKIYVDNNTNLLISDLALSTGIWYHIAFCRVGTGTNQSALYVNGTQVKFGTIATDFSNSNLRVGGTIDNYSLNGYIDDLRITKGVGRYPYNFTPPTAAFPNIGGTVTLTADPYFKNTTLLLPGNGTNGAQNNTFLDSSSNAFTITRNGNTTQGTFTPFSQTGWGNYFDGTSGQYLNTVANTAFNLGTGDFTVEGWVYPTSTTGTRPIVEIRTAGANSTGFALLSQSGATTLNVYTAGAFVGASTNSLATNQWNHVALTRSGNTWTYWINGTSGGSFTNSSTQSDGATTGPKIGGSTAAGEVWVGYLSNIRITKGGALYTANFTPSTTPLTTTVSAGTVSLLTCQSNRFLDTSANAFAITVNGSPSVQAFSPFAPTAAYSASTNGGSGYFDGSGDYLTLTGGVTNNGTGDLTLEFWSYYTGTYSAYAQAFDSRTSPFTNGFGVSTDITTGYWTMNFTAQDILTSTPVAKNAWQHVAITRSGNTFRLFVDGVLRGTVTSSNNLTNTTNVIGASYSYGSAWPGYIADLRGIKGSIPAAYQTSSTTVGTVVFTPPTAPLTAVSGTSLLLSSTNAGITDATAKNDLETVGNAQISTTQSKFGGSSMYFDGTGDWLIVPSSTQFGFGTGDFTVECWVYTTSFSAVQALVDARPSNTATPWALSISSTGLARTYDGTTVRTGGQLTASAWNHVAWSRYNGTNNVYVNGILGHTWSASTDFGSSKPLTIGAGTASSGETLTGYIDDLRITKGIARYTSNFTPPTTAFLLQ